MTGFQFYFYWDRTIPRQKNAPLDKTIIFFIVLSKGSISLHENDAFVIPLGEAHTYYADEKDPWSLLWVHFKGEDTVYYPLDEKKIQHFTSEYAANRMFSLFDMLFRALDKDYTLGTFIYISQVLSLILSEVFFRNLENVPLEDRNLTAIIRYMNRHIHEELSLEELLLKFHCSKSYMHRLFQTKTHHAPMNFFTRLKMSEACKMLRSNKHVYEVAHELGYKDPYYFSRLFKKIVGLSPQQYKNSDVYTEL